MFTYPVFFPLSLVLMAGAILLLVRFLMGGFRQRPSWPFQPAYIAGMVLFFMIWETNARYPFNFTPLYMLLATDGLDGFSQSLKARKRDHGAVMK